MISRWFQYKREAIQLRKQGYSMNQIEHKFGIARSTLSGWFKKVKLTSTQRKKLAGNSKIALVAARKKAVLWHNAQKQKRIEEAKLQAIESLKHINIHNNYTCELALAILYLGEGTKATPDTSMGSSDPLILKFFLSCLKKIYGLDAKKIKCELHLRADQNPITLKRFWAKELNIPLSNFKQTTIDRRTVGSKTYPSYKGVCVLRCGNVAIQRKLLFLSRSFCEQIANKHSGS